MTFPVSKFDCRYLRPGTGIYEGCVRFAQTALLHFPSFSIVSLFLTLTHPGTHPRGLTRECDCSFTPFYHHSGTTSHLFLQSFPRLLSRLHFTRNTFLFPILRWCQCRLMAYVSFHGGRRQWQWTRETTTSSVKHTKTEGRRRRRRLFIKTDLEAFWKTKTVLDGPQSKWFRLTRNWPTEDTSFISNFWEPWNTIRNIVALWWHEAGTELRLKNGLESLGFF